MVVVVTCDSGVRRGYCMQWAWIDQGLDLTPSADRVAGSEDVR